MAGIGRARRAGVVLALTVSGFVACGGEAPVPPVPSDLRRLEQREAGCLACHDGRRAPGLSPDVTATPTGHPPLAVAKALEQLSSAGRSLTVPGAR